MKWHYQIRKKHSSELQAVRSECFGTRGDRPEAKNVAIVITDGVPFPEDRYEPAITEAEKLRKEDGNFLDSLIC